MSADTKLDPASLTAEERAIVDAAATMWNLGCVRYNATDVYKEALKQAEPFILSRRAIFGDPEPKLAHGLDSDGEPDLLVCPNCGKLTSLDHCQEFEGQGYRWSCARPEPEQRPICNPYDHHWACRGCLDCAPPEPAQPAAPRPKLGQVRLAMQLTSSWALSANERLVIVAAIAELNQWEGK